MPFAQFIDQYGVALHAGHLPGRPASHGCVRLPSAFAKKLFATTDIGTPVLIGA
jgi:lipoprotein-anchoring transpeptidase ErfK/SrfK